MGRVVPTFFAGSHFFQRAEGAVEDPRGMPIAQGALQFFTDLRETGLVDHELTSQIHQLIQPLDLHTERLGRFGSLSLARLLGAASAAGVSATCRGAGVKAGSASLGTRISAGGILASAVSRSQGGSPEAVAVALPWPGSSVVACLAASSSAA